MPVEDSYIRGNGATTSYVDLPDGETKQVRGTVLMVLKKLPNGSWKVFRAMGSTE